MVTFLRRWGNDSRDASSPHRPGTAPERRGDFSFRVGIISRLPRSFRSSFRRWSIPTEDDFFNTPLAGSEPAIPRIWRYRDCARAGQNRARAQGGIPMELEGGKRMDRATRIPQATEPVLSARSELLKNTINTDKFTGFFDKKLKREILANHCNILSLFEYLSVCHSNKAAKKFQTSAFARISDEIGAILRISPQVLHTPHPCPARGRVLKNRDGFSRRNER